MRRKNAREGRESSAAEKLKPSRQTPDLIDSEPLLPVSPNAQKLILFSEYHGRDDMVREEIS